MARSGKSFAAAAKTFGANAGSDCFCAKPAAIDGVITAATCPDPCSSRPIAAKAARLRPDTRSVIFVPGFAV